MARTSVLENYKFLSRTCFFIGIGNFKKLTEIVPLFFPTIILTCHCMEAGTLEVMIFFETDLEFSQFESRLNGVVFFRQQAFSHTTDIHVI